MSDFDAMRDLTCDEVRELAAAYVLDALEADEAAAVRSHLAAHPDGHPEIAELGAVIPAFAEIVPIVEPPDSLKGRIMAAAAADLAARGAGIDEGTAGTAPTSPPPAAPAAQPKAPAAPVAFPTAEEREARRARTSPGAWVLRIAAVLAIALLGGWNLLLQNQLTSAQAYERNVAAVLDAAAEPGSLTAILASEGTGSGLASVQGDGDLAIAMRDLAPTTGDTVYEAWVIGADGVPVPVGNFRVGDSGIGFLTAGGLPAAEGITLALTLEPGPGATTPTMPIISAGVAGAPD
jgi:anti-sigma-K factor RskA